MHSLVPYMLVFLGGGIGSASRLAVNRLAHQLSGPGFPAGTMAVNIGGCFVMGVLAGLFAFSVDAPQHVRLFLMTGLLGGFTTFSAFALDIAVLYERGNLAAAAGYMAASVIISIAALFAGLALVRQVTS